MVNRMNIFPIKIAAMRPSLLILLLAGWMLLTSSQAQARKYDDLDISYIETPQPDSWHGYAEYVFLIKNDSKDNSHQVTLTLPNTSYSRGESGIRRIQRTVEIKPGQTSKVRLFQPAVGIEGTDVGVRIDGRERETLNSPSFRHNPWNSGSSGGSSDARPQMILVGPILDTNSLERSLQLASARTKPVLTHFRGSPSEWSDHWLSYSRYDAVILRRLDYQTLPDGVRRALLDWNMAGGTLVIVGKGPTPPDWTPSATRSRATNNLQFFDAGFGKGAIATSEKLQDLSNADRSDIIGLIDAGWTPWVEPPNLESMVHRMPMIKADQLSLGWPFILMVIFTGLILVSMFVLARKNRRIWLLWVIPALSIGASLTLFGYSLLAEGITGTASSLSLTVLDERVGRAMTIGYLGFYSPLTPGNGLEFETTTEISPVIQEEYSYRYRYRRSSGSEYTMDWSTGQHLASGWISARSPTYLRVRKAAPSQLRVSFEKDTQGAYWAVNGLGVTILSVATMMEDGGIYTSEIIEAGKKGKLELNRGKAIKPDSSRFIQSVYQHPDWTVAIADSAKQQAAVKPGQYLAVVEISPFLESGLEGARRKSDTAVILGIRKEDGR